MTAILTAVSALLLGALLPLLFARRAHLLSSAVVAGASVIGLSGAAWALGAGPPAALPADTPLLGVDPLGALFLVPLFVVGPVAVACGAVLRPRGGIASARNATHFALLPLLLASMTLVFVAHDGLVLLLAWEATSVIITLLFTHGGTGTRARRVALVFFVGSQAGVAALVPLVLLLGDGATAFSAFAGPRPAKDGLLFALALAGFGLEVGLVPLCVWLADPERSTRGPGGGPVAHGGSHLSALLSGLLVTTGVYGLLRTLTFLGPPPAVWGGLLVLLGLGSALTGVVFARAQTNLDRLLAGSTLHHHGLVLAGVGLSLLGIHIGSPAIAITGMAGALLHTWNHAISKPLLILAAGAVRQRVGTGAIDRLGGLMRRMPLTGRLFGIAALAVVAVPPLSGFASELLLYLAAGAGLLSPRAEIALVGAGTLAGLALAGGLSAAMFAKAFRATFLGDPRSVAASQAHEPPPGLVRPMMALAALVVLAGLLAPLLLAAVAPAVSDATGYDLETAQRRLQMPATVLWTTSGIGGVVLGLGLVLGGLRRRLRG
jgi:formate hydrogenlyase subunit 3/multisubunit Na+/H+ antiporter MnhD subunit